MNLIRHLIVCGLLLTNCNTSIAQAGIREISRVKTQTLKYDDSEFSFDYSVPFRKIDVIDYRFDTTKIGYATYNRPDNHTRLVAKGGVQEFLNHRLNDYFKHNLDPGSSRTLVIVLKKLWLQYGATNRLLYAKDVDNTSTLSDAHRNAVCLADIDVFAGTDTLCQALIRLSYNFPLNQPLGRYSDAALLLRPFDSLISRIHEMDVAALLATKKNFRINEINANYKKRFDIPVLSLSQFSRGIFLSFEDFKNNKASYPDFKYKISELSTDITVIQDGKPVAITDYWAFFDGKELFIKPGFVPFKVMRQGNTFDMLGSLTSANRYDIVPMPLPGMPLARVQMTVIPAYPLQVDMETGKVY